MAFCANKEKRKNAYEYGIVHKGIQKNKIVQSYTKKYRINGNLKKIQLKSFYQQNLIYISSHTLELVSVMTH